MSDRREFLKQACVTCAAVMGFGVAALELESCKTADNTSIGFSKNQVTVPLKQMEGKNSLLLKSASLDYDIALVKKTETDYLAFEMICTHRHNPIVLSENGFHCPSHGSNFDSEGNAIKGPAKEPLKRFVVKVDENNAVIFL